MTTLCSRLETKMSYFDDIIKLERKITELNVLLNETNNYDYRKQIISLEEQIKRLRLLEWEENTERLDYSEDR
jgi:hypothetical protein